jgi:hypothetical protein
MTKTISAILFAFDLLPCLRAGEILLRLFINSRIAQKLFKLLRRLFASSALDSFDFGFALARFAVDYEFDFRKFRAAKAK